MTSFDTCPPEIIAAIAERADRRSILSMRLVGFVFCEAIDCSGELFRIAVDAALDYVMGKYVHKLDLCIESSPFASILRKCYPASTKALHTLVPEVILTSMYPYLNTTDLSERNFFAYDFSCNTSIKTIVGTIEETRLAFPLMDRVGDITDEELLAAVDVEDRMRNCGVLMPALNYNEVPSRVGQYNQTPRNMNDRAPAEYYMQQIYARFSATVHALITDPRVAVARDFVAGIIIHGVYDAPIELFMICSEDDAKPLIAAFVRASAATVVQTIDDIVIDTGSQIIKIVKKTYTSIEALLYSIDIPTHAIAIYRGEIRLTFAAYYAYVYNVDSMNYHLWTKHTYHNFVRSTRFQHAQVLHGFHTYASIKTICDKAVSIIRNTIVVPAVPLTTPRCMTDAEAIAHNIRAITDDRELDCVSHTNALIAPIDDIFALPVYMSSSKILVDRVSETMAKIRNDVNAKLVAVDESIELDGYSVGLFDAAIENLDNVMLNHYRSVGARARAIDINGSWQRITETNIAESLKTLGPWVIFR